MSTNPAIIATLISLEQISDLELAAFNNLVQLDFGDPRLLPGYDKIKHLFTEKDGTRCHDVVKEGFAAAVNRRLPPV